MVRPQQRKQVLSRETASFCPEVIAGLSLSCYVQTCFTVKLRGVAEFFVKLVGTINYSIYCPAERWCLYREISIPPPVLTKAVAQNHTRTWYNVKVGGLVVDGEKALSISCTNQQVPLQVSTAFQSHDCCFWSERSQLHGVG